MTRPVVPMVFILATGLLTSPVASRAGGTCPDSHLFSGAMITDICWSCVFPIRVAGMRIGTSGSSIPKGAAKSPLCACPGKMGIPVPGFVTSMWEPARIIELERAPGCLSALNGARLPIDRAKQGSHGNGERAGGDISFMHVHYYAFPVFSILKLFVPQYCNGDDYMDFDLLYLSELDPTWNDDELAFFVNPEAAAVANPAAMLACLPDAVASTAGKPIREMFWCAGSWGTLYPVSGHVNGPGGVMRNSSLLAARALAKLHRAGLARKTMGKDAMCTSKYVPFLPKTQYRFSTFWPVAQTHSNHVMGQSTLIWGSDKILPGVGEDPVYIVWRWNDCCNSGL